MALQFGAGGVQLGKNHVTVIGAGAETSKEEENPNLSKKVVDLTLPPKEKQRAIQILGKDRQELRTTKALAQMIADDLTGAFRTFLECCEYVHDNISPTDESIACFLTFASALLLILAREWGLEFDVQ